MIHRFLTWRIYSWILGSILFASVLIWIYAEFFTDVWSGVDGGIPAAVTLGYITFTGVFFGSSQLLYLYTKRRNPKIIHRFLIIFWLMVTGVILLSTIYAIKSHYQQEYYEQHVLPRYQLDLNKATDQYP